ncbi:hypothetical protein O1611_g4049 [Lasiodiplodia mahajangana]|uniref:Uncharacterized protein n=1 Tax=Lasiodiplodia mahajangana TaxID=1108764 RepID=A0ACC2JQ23_9PEZI|nr:hypothetical protein O1611_g4049 [Lasiodiplodia mahajangana]
MNVNNLSQTSKLAEQAVLDGELEYASGNIISDWSPRVVAFTPINRPTHRAIEYGSVPTGVAHVAVGGSVSNGLKRAAECDKTAVGKKTKTTIGDSYSTSSPAQTLAAFRSLRANTTIEQLITYRTRISHASNPLSLETVRFCNHDHEQSIRKTGTNEPAVPAIIPCTQESVSKSIDKSNNAFPSSSIVESSSPITLGGSKLATLETDAINRQSDSSDSYPLEDGIVDDDILQLLTDTPGFIQETHIPPSSVRGWDHESRSATDYDPGLKYTPPDPQGDDADTSGMGHASANRQAEDSEGLLDEDVDWNVVLANVNSIRQDAPVNSNLEPESSKCEDTDMHSKGPSEPHSYNATSFTTWVRPPFPEKVRDRPSVPSMSSDTVLRTCFRIGVLISQTACCFNHKQDVVFELYARVTYSSRETLARKQHFQFVDLCKDQHPYPAATLTNWRVGSQLDQNSSAFLDISGGPRLCRSSLGKKDHFRRFWGDMTIARKPSQRYIFSTFGAIYVCLLVVVAGIMMYAAEADFIYQGGS